MTAFWDIAKCRLVQSDRRFEDAYYLSNQGNAVLMMAVSTSET
jgi:hypothetical protein